MGQAKKKQKIVKVIDFKIFIIIERYFLLVLN
jgi:hypothetical protein